MTKKSDPLVQMHLDNIFVDPITKEDINVTT